MSEKYINLDFAKIDIDRLKRKKYPEAIFCESKSDAELLEIFRALYKKNENILGTRAKKEQFELIKKEFNNVEYNEKARVLTLMLKKIEKKGKVAIVTAGTGDIPVALEAKLCAEFYGSNTETFFDCGVAGIHRLFDKIDEIRKANVIIAIAGMEGALPSIVAGLCDSPVIALPVSIGYGASFGGIAALLAMLNSCAEGLCVVNIDNGFGAGYLANQINRKIEGV